LQLDLAASEPSVSLQSESSSLSLEAVFVPENPDYESVAVLTEVVAKLPLDFSTEALAYPHDGGVFSNGSDTVAFELTEYILADLSQESARPTVAGDADVDVICFVAIQDDAVDNDAVLLCADRYERRGEGDANSSADELDNPFIRNDHRERWPQRAPE
jgi:hypothetical protein